MEALVVSISSPNGPFQLGSPVMDAHKEPKRRQPPKNWEQ